MNNLLESVFLVKLFIRKDNQSVYMVQVETFEQLDELINQLRRIPKEYAEQIAATSAKTKIGLQVFLVKGTGFFSDSFLVFDSNFPTSTPKQLNNNSNKDSESTDNIIRFEDYLKSKKDSSRAVENNTIVDNNYETENNRN